MAFVNREILWTNRIWLVNKYLTRAIRMLTFMVKGNFLLLIQIIIKALNNDRSSFDIENIQQICDEWRKQQYMERYKSHNNLIKTLHINNIWHYFYMKHKAMCPTGNIKLNGTAIIHHLISKSMTLENLFIYCLIWLLISHKPVTCFFYSKYILLYKTCANIKLQGNRISEELYKVCRSFF